MFRKKNLWHVPKVFLLIKKMFCYHILPVQLTKLPDSIYIYYSMLNGGSVPGFPQKEGEVSMFLFAKMMIKHHIKRSYLIILGIACSVAMMFGMIQMGDSINSKYKELALGTERYDFKVNGLTMKQAGLLKEELEQEEIEEAGILYTYSGENVWKPKAYQKVALQLYAGKEAGLEGAGFRLAGGRWSESSDEIVLERYVCEILGSKVGDEIAILGDPDGEPYRFRLAGIMENTSALSDSGWTEGTMCVSFDFLNEAGLITPDEGGYTLIVTVTSDIDDYDGDKNAEVNRRARIWVAQNLYGVEDYYGMIDQHLYGQVSEEEMASVREVGTRFEGNSLKSASITDYEDQSVAGNALKSVALVLVVSMILLIFNSMYLTIAENTRELGMLRCIGMDYRQTGLIILAENGFYCISGYGIGIAFGNLLSYVGAKNILYYLTGDHIKIRQLGVSYLLTAAVLFISLVMAFVLSMRKILALEPVEASRYNGLTVKNQKVHVMESWSSVKFAERNIKRERGKSVVVMLSMIFSMMILMVIINTMSSVEMPEKDPKSRFSKYEVYIPLYGRLDAMEGMASVGISFSEVEEVRNVTGVEEVYAIGDSLDMEESLHQRSGLYISSMIYNDALFQWLLKQNGKEELWKDGVDVICAVAGEYEEEKQELLDEIEETGAIAYRQDNGKEGILNVDLVLRTDYLPEDNGYGSGEPVMIILSEQAAAEIYTDYTYTDVMINCNSDAGEGTYVSIIQVFLDNEYAIFGSYENDKEKIFTDTLVIVYLAAMIVFATAVTAVLNMMIIMRANLILRRKEHGIWRALGMSLKRLKGTIRIEILLMIFVSWVIAVTASIPLQGYMLSAMEKNVNIPIMAAGYLGVGVVSILLVYPLVMAGVKFKKTNEIIADIREE